MGCCILAAIIASQFIMLRRRVRALFWPDRAHAAAAAPGASAWRPHGAELSAAGQSVPSAPAPYRAPRSARLQWQRAIVVVVAVACGYVLAAHAAHLRDVALGRSGAWQALINDTWCGSFSSRRS